MEIWRNGARRGAFFGGALGFGAALIVLLWRAAEILLGAEPDLLNNIGSLGLACAAVTAIASPWLIFFALAAEGRLHLEAQENATEQAALAQSKRASDAAELHRAAEMLSATIPTSEIVFEEVYEQVLAPNGQPQTLHRQVALCVPKTKPNLAQRVSALHMLREIARGDVKSRHWAVMQILLDHLRRERAAIKPPIRLVTDEEVLMGEREYHSFNPQRRRRWGEMLARLRGRRMQKLNAWKETLETEQDAALIAEIIRKRSSEQVAQDWIGAPDVSALDQINAQEIPNAANDIRQIVGGWPNRAAPYKISAAPLHYLDLSGADFRKLANPGNGDMSRLSMMGVKLHNADLRGADLSHADLFDAEFNNADMRGAYLMGADLHWTSLQKTYLRGADLSRANLINIWGLWADFSEAQMRGAKLHCSLLTGAAFRGANLQEANLQGATAVDVDFSGASFERSHLQNASLQRAKLHSARLADAQLAYADLTEADLTGAGFTQANLDGACLAGANLSETYLQQSQLEQMFADDKAFETLPQQSPRGEAYVKPAHWMAAGQNPAQQWRAWLLSREA